MENKYKKGELVCERTHPLQKLIVNDFSGGLYYCKIWENPKRKDLVYFERDLTLLIKKD